METKLKLDPLLIGAIATLNRYVADTWRVQNLVSQGSFGAVYRMISEIRTNYQVAIKVGKKEKGRERCSSIEWEVHVMRHQGQNARCPAMHGYQIGNTEIEYIIMELLGQSLSMIQESNGYSPIEAGKVANLGFQCVDAIRSLHRTGFIHRDVKPGNFALGIGRGKDFIYLIDFGLARRIRLEDGSLLPPRSPVKFCGTPHYASIRALANEDQSMADDLVSLFYTLCELISGKLPWPLDVSCKEVKLHKEKSHREGTIVPLGARWLERFGEHVLSLKYADEPMYTKLQRFCARKMQKEVARGSDVLTLTPMYRDGVAQLKSREQVHPAVKIRRAGGREESGIRRTV